MKVYTVEQAAREILDGGIVAYPTETCYGLAVLADDAKAVEDLRKLKGMDSQRGISVLVPDSDCMDEYVESIPQEAKSIMDEFWPGPLTLVLKAKPGIFADGIATPDGNVGFRCSSLVETAQLASRVGRPLTSTSANYSEQSEIAGLDDLFIHFDTKIAGVLSGKCRGWNPSTVVNVSDGKIEVLRQGPISYDDIMKAVSSTSE